MKKVSLLLLVVFAAFATISCSSSKKLGSVKMGKDIIKYSMDEPQRRAYGNSSHFKEETARRGAEANARAALASAIQTMVMQSFDYFAGSVASTGSADGVEGLLTEEQFANLSDAVRAISNESVRNTVAVKMERYKPEGTSQFTVYSCVEHRLEVSDLIKSISEKISQTVPNDIKMSIKYNKAQHEESMKESFENYQPVSY